MTEEQISQTLLDAIKVRFPRTDPNEHASLKIQGLESYLTETAVVRGDLEEALFWAREAEKVLEDRWDDLTGWEALRDRRRDTDQSVVDAKRKVSPDLYRSLRNIRRMIHDIGRQIKRLEKDYDAVSRDYTLITGG